MIITIIIIIKQTCINITIIVILTMLMIYTYICMYAYQRQRLLYKLHAAPICYTRPVLQAVFGVRTANPPTNIVDFSVFDSSITLIKRGGILMYTGNLLESLSQAMLVGRVIGRRGMNESSLLGGRAHIPAAYTYIYIYIHMSIHIYICIYIYIYAYVRKRRAAQDEDGLQRQQLVVVGAALLLCLASSCCFCRRCDNE